MKSSKSALAGGKGMIGASLIAAMVAVAGPSVAAETVKIYRSTMPDGSVVLGDKPSAGARSVASDTYVLTAPRGAADAERDYWRRQSDAFNLRQQRREAAQARRSRTAAPQVDDLAMYGEQWLPVGVHYGNHHGKPLVPPHLVPRNYTSSPGAVNGRASGFIGSGFSTAR